jgi:hypothetical protein
MLSRQDFQGNIKFFNIKFDIKTEHDQTIELTPKIISINKGNIHSVKIPFFELINKIK